MLARSSLLVLLTGCDLMFGLTGQPFPCELGAFDGATPRVIGQADSFSIDWDQTYAVLARDGAVFEMDLPAGEPTMIELGVYMNLGLSLTPEADALLYTIAIEPYELRGALRDSDVWQLDAAVPRGTYAGTPSADVFGPRRVLVRMRMIGEEVQEYEDRDGRWVAVGAPFEVPSMFAPNLTPNGLTMVFDAIDAEGMPGVFAKQRTHVDKEFGEPVALIRGAFSSPQLCGSCRQLYALADGQLVRLDR